MRQPRGSAKTMATNFDHHHHHHHHQLQNQLQHQQTAHYFNCRPHSKSFADTYHQQVAPFGYHQVLVDTTTSYHQLQEQQLQEQQNVCFNLENKNHASNSSAQDSSCKSSDVEFRPAQSSVIDRLLNSRFVQESSQRQVDTQLATVHHRPPQNWTNSPCANAASPKLSSEPIQSGFARSCTIQHPHHFDADLTPLVMNPNPPLN